MGTRIALVPNASELGPTIIPEEHDRDGASIEELRPRRLASGSARAAA
jgi:hypothetical protein